MGEGSGLQEGGVHASGLVQSWNLLQVSNYLENSIVISDYIRESIGHLFKK